MRFKGQTIRTKQKQYVLKDQLTEGGFSTIYATNFSQIICKVQVLSVPAIAYAYKKQKQILAQFKSHPSIVKLHDSTEMKIGDNAYGFLLLENCSNGTAFSQLQNTQGSLSEKDILKIFLAVATVLESMHKEGISHRDIKMQNVLRNEKGEYKICDFGSATTQIIKTIDNSNRVDIEQFIEKTTTPFYRSPEQLDLYSGLEIGPKVDIFAAGVLVFMLCFRKPPFQARLSAINKQYFIPQDCVYSEELLKLLQKCFTTNPKHRPSSRQLKKQLQILSKRKKALIQLDYKKEVKATLDHLSRVNAKALNKSTKEIIVQTSFFDRIKLMYTQYTTETEGWIRGFVEDSEEAPSLKYNRFIISKCWEKRYKIQKVYQIIWNSADENQSKSLVILKLLILIHNFLRKGPTQAAEYDKEYSMIRLATKLYKNWKFVETSSETDVKRNVFLCLLIRYYCLLIIGKARFAYEYSDLFEGNYSIVPFFSKKQEKTLLKLPILESMLEFLQICASFHETVQNNSYVLQIQRSIILSIVDEEYCLVSTFVFVYAAFKHGISYVDEDLDMARIQEKLDQIETRFQRVYTKLIGLFEVAQKFSSLFEYNTFLLSRNVLIHLKNIKITNKRKGIFKITDFLNYRDNIGGLKLPLTYEQVIKNPNFLKNLANNQNPKKQQIEIDQYKMKKQQQKHNNQQAQQTSQINHPPSIVSPAKSETITNTYNVISNNKQKMHSITSFQEFGMLGNLTQQLNHHSTSLEKPFMKHDDSEIPRRQQHYNTMEFTHQLLNNDFMTVDGPGNMVKPESTSDKFKDFMSIVNMKVDQDKRKSEKPASQQVIPQKQNFNSQNSQDNQKADQQMNKVEEVDLINGPQVYLSSTTNPIQNSNDSNVRKVEMVNFFEDDEETHPPIKEKANDIGLQGEPKVLQYPVQQQYSFDTSFSRGNALNKTDIFPNQQPQLNSAKKQIRSEKKIRGSDSFIDLKGFVLDQVRKSAQQYLLDFKSLQFFEKVGNGHSSEVYRGEWRGREVAIKKIKDDMRSSNVQKQFKREIMTSVKIRNHPQLVTLIGVAEFKGEHYIINEFCYGLTLFDVLHESSVSLPWKIRISIAKQIAKGIVFLHTNQPPIIHRDLKSLNVLLANKYEEGAQQIQIKIADFGLSRDFASTYMTGTLGTYHWMAPEIFNNEPYSLKADVYSYGIVLWEIAARSPPYRNIINPQALMKFITLENGRPDITAIDPKTPLEIRMLMMRCWDRFPSNRPDFSEILNVLNSVF